MNGWSWWWLSWFTVSFVTFILPEAYCLVTGHVANTLSWTVWRAESFLPGESVWHWTALHVLLGGALFVGLVWLACHLFFGIWR
jgi:hypothetical protein